MRVWTICRVFSDPVTFEFMHVLIHKQDLQLMVSGIACAPSETPDLCQYLKFTLWQDESTDIYLPSK